MIRPLTIATFLLASGSGLYLYQSKHEAQVLDRTIEKTVRDTAAFREQSRLLSAEWTMLNDPEALQRFSDTYLALKPIAPSQFTSLADLDGRLPPVDLPASSPSQGMDDDAPTPIASVSPDAAPSTAAAPPVVPAQVAATRPTLPAAAASAHPSERKVATGRPASSETAALPRTITVGNSHPVDPHIVEPRPTEQRGFDARSHDAQSTEARMSRGSKTRVVDAKASEGRPASAVPPLHPTVLAAMPRSTSAAAFAGAPSAAPPPAAFTGSFLGTARGSAATIPRPTPVTATQWPNFN